MIFNTKIITNVTFTIHSSSLQLVSLCYSKHRFNLTKWCWPHPPPTSRRHTNRQAPHPIKFIVTRWRMICAKMKSANPRSGETPTNWCRFWGLACKRKLTVGSRESQVSSVCCIFFATSIHLKTPQMSLWSSTGQVAQVLGMKYNGRKLHSWMDYTVHNTVQLDTVMYILKSINNL